MEQQKTCAQCAAAFTIFDRDQAFYKKVGAPLPRSCPSCRLQKRLSYRNERALYSNVCAKCKKNILAIFNPADGFVVYCNDCWAGDSWGGETYGRDIDWNRSLLEQWNDLRHAVPQQALVRFNSENCDYTNMSGDNKNCYLLFAAEHNENCSYGKLVQDCKDTFDCNFAYESQLCYQCIGINNCYRCIYVQDSQDSNECGFSIGLRGCTNVFLSSNQHNKQYVIRNQQVTQEEYERQVAELTKNYDAIQRCIAEWIELKKHRIVKYANVVKSEDATADSLTDCKRVHHCFDVTRGQDCAYLTDALDPKDSYDCSNFYYGCELIYDSLSMLQTYNVHYSVFAFYCQNCEYCDQVHHSNDLFLCTGIRKGKCMILNKQYSETEYRALLPKVIEKMKADGEYGELPAMKYSVHAYNDTVAYEYFPMTREEATKRGLKWNENADARYTGSDAMPAAQLPPTIEAVTDDILNTVIVCEQSGKAYKITKAELEFLRLMHLPLPHVHPEMRHRSRMNMRNPRTVWHRTCQCATIPATATDHAHGAQPCTVEFDTTYAPEREEKVYCEECYLKEIF